MGIDLSKYKDLFISEIRDYITQLNELILELEKKGSDQNILNELMRIFHSIKGSSAAMGLEELSKFAHRVEDLLTEIRNRNVKITSDIVDVLLEAVDLIDAYVNAYDKNKQPPDTNTVLQNIESMITKVSAGTTEDSEKKGTDKLPKETSKEPTEEAGDTKEIVKKMVNELNDVEKEKLLVSYSQGLRLYLVRVELDPSTAMPMIRAFMILQNLAENGEIIKSEPDPSDLPRLEEKVINILVASQTEDELKEALSKIPDIKNYSITHVNYEELGIDLSQAHKELKVKPISIELDSLIKKFEESIETKESATIEFKGTTEARKIEEIRVKVEHLDKLFNLVGELVLIKSRLSRIAKKYGIPELRETVLSFEGIVNLLQEEVMNIRLVPLAQVFNLLPRYVRDLARELGKEVDLIIEGKDISIDRKILEEIVDPLIHIVRNAIDHGIEPPEERERKGKIRVGTIRISARKERQYAIIEVEDDGRGIDVEKVKRIAIERGLITKEMAEKMSDEEAIMLITLPGFSTRSMTSEISGRGMGMSAVKEKIESLGGVLEIYSQKDKGTKVVMKLPISLVTLKALLVKVSDEIYAIPTSAIESTIQLTSKQIKKTSGNPVIVYQDKVIPLINLADIVGTYNTSEPRFAIIANVKNKMVAVGVEDIIGQEDIVVKSLGKALQGLPGISGVTILGDGKVRVILDLYSLL